MQIKSVIDFFLPRQHVPPSHNQVEIDDSALFESSFGNPPEVIHEPLRDPTSFRFLEVLPAQSLEQPLRCHLWDASDRDRSPETFPGYVALSYVWDDFSHTETVTINGQSFEIRDNLADALRELRSEFCTVEQSPCSFLIWIDAICINQSDGAEKASQVRQMDKIYAQASEVLIWLGKTGRDAAETFKIMDDLEIAWRTADIYNYDVRSHLQRLEDSRKEPLRRLSELMCNPWFTRVWTIQEVVLPQHATLIWGSHRLNAAKLLIPVTKARFWEAINPGQTRPRKPGHRHEQQLLVHAINQIRVPQIAKGVPWRYDQIPELLGWTGAYRCTDDRDRVYGVLGLLEPKRDGLPVDYTKSLAEVFIDVVRVCIQSAQDLTILSYAEMVASSKKGPSSSLATGSALPSWCPDWTDPHRGTHRYLKLCRGRKTYDAGKATPFAATRHMPPNVAINMDTKTLSVEGYRIQTIHWTSIPLDRVYEDQDVPHATLAQTVHEALQSLSNPMELPNLHAELWSTITADLWVKRGAQPVAYYRISREGLPGFPPQNKTEQEMLIKERKNSSQLWAPLHRRLLVTSAPPFLALGPLGARRGDVICALFGGDCLYVLGERDGCWRFIGEW